jgi:predicted phage baseplate assembly protein
MGLEAPRLDDREFADLVAEARARISLFTPEWTDHNLSDPGMTLIELFAYMMDVALYRLNRVPDKNYIKFMELIGMKLAEAVPAQTDVTFWLSAPQQIEIVIPADTEVSTTQTEDQVGIVFSTDRDLRIQVPQLSYVLTSMDTDDGTDYNIQSLSTVQSGYEQFPIFATESPKTNDALYIGFDQDLSNHLLGLNFQVDRAEGAGIDPNNPPYVWEALSTGLDRRWTRIYVDLDDTKGFNVNGLIRVQIPEMVRSSRSDINAYWIRCRLDLTETESRYEVSPRLVRLGVESWGGTVATTNVTSYKDAVLGRSDGSPGQIFYLDHAPVVARTTDEYIIIRTTDGREQRWQEVGDFSTSTGTDRHYTIDSETGEVRFGPALPQPDGQVKRYGTLPPKDSLVIITGYRYGGGREGNVAARSINVLKSSIPYLSRVMNLRLAHGGLDAELLDNAKMRVPGHLRSLRRAVTSADYEYLAQQSAPGSVGRVYCLQPPLTNRGENRILVIPSIPVLTGFIAPESLELSTDVHDTIKAYLDERRLLSTQLEVTAPTYMWVETEVRFSTSQHFEFEQVKVAVENKLFDFVNPLIGSVDGKGWPFGRDLLVGDIMAILSTVPGVNFIRSVKLYPVTYENRQFIRGNEINEIAVPSDGLVVSYQHLVLED